MNGVNELNVQMYIAIFICIVNIPISIYFGKVLNMGIIGVMIAQILTALPGAIILPIKAINFIKNSR